MGCSNLIGEQPLQKLKVQIFLKVIEKTCPPNFLLSNQSFIHVLHAEG